MNAPSSPRPSRALLAMAAALFGFLASVHVFLSPGGTEGGPGQQIPEARGAKVMLLLVDGLRPEDAADPRLTFLEPFRQSGFVAKVSPCLEALTVPCVSEAFTGTATAGLLGAYHNLVSSGGEQSSSLFADVRATGRRTAVVHQGQYGAYAGSLSKSYRGKSEWPIVRGYIKSGVDFIVWHYAELDEGSHHHRVGSAGYQATLDQLDADAKLLLAALPSNYRLVVAGDHGHTASGRHIFGLDVPTAYLSGSQTFGSAPVSDTLPIATYRYLLGAELGILPPDRYDGVNLAARLPEGSALREAAEARRFVGPVRDATPHWVLGASLGLGAVAWWAVPHALRLWLALGLGLAGLSGWLYLTVLPLIHYTTGFPYVRQRIVGAALLVGLAAWAARRDARALGAGMLLVAIALPATLYDYGMFQSTEHLLFALTLVLAASRRRALAELPMALGALLVLGGAWYLMSDFGVGTFAIFSFRKLKLTTQTEAIVAWALLAGLLARGWRWRLLAAGLAALGASGRVPVGSYPLAALTLLIFVAAIRFPWALPVLGAWASLAWYGKAAGVGVVCCALFAAAAVRLTANDPRTREWFASATAVLMGWFSLAYTARLRTNGLDFDFAIQWLPGDLHLRLWPIVAVATVVKVFLAPALVGFAVERAGGEVSGRAMGWVVYPRLAGIAAGVAGLLVHSADPPRYRLMEQLEEQVGWLLLLAVLLGLGHARRALRGAA